MSQHNVSPAPGMTFPAMVGHESFTRKPAATGGPHLVTVTIGRNVAAASHLAMWQNGDAQRPMTLRHWDEFQSDIRGLLALIVGDRGTVFGPFSGTGEWEGVPEDSVTFTALIDREIDVEAFTRGFGSILEGYAVRWGQDAIAYAVGPARLATRS